MLYLGATSATHAASGDGPVAGGIVDEFNLLYPTRGDGVIVTTACLQGNPFVPSQPPSSLLGTPTLSGCKLDIPGGSTDLADNTQLIIVLPNNFTARASVRTYGTGRNVALESGVTVDAVSKDIYFGLANPQLFDASASPSVDVQTTADVFCTSINNSFTCVKIEPGPGASTSCPLLPVLPNEASFCDNLTGLLQGAYNLQRNPLAYAISTDMRTLGQTGSVALSLCPGFKAQCLSPAATPVAPFASNVRVTTMHTQAAFVETPRLRLPYY